jgi:hypothetical protein
MFCEPLHDVKADVRPRRWGGSTLSMWAHFEGANVFWGHRKVARGATWLAHHDVMQFPHVFCIRAMADSGMRETFMAPDLRPTFFAPSSLKRDAHGANDCTRFLSSYMLAQGFRVRPPCGGRTWHCMRRCRWFGPHAWSRNCPHGHGHGQRYGRLRRQARRRRPAGRTVDRLWLRKSWVSA